MDIEILLSKTKVNGVKIEHLNKRNKAFHLVGKMNNAENDKKKMDEMAQILADYYNKKWEGSTLYKCFPYVGLRGEYCVLIKSYSI